MAGPKGRREVRLEGSQCGSKPTSDIIHDIQIDRSQDAAGGRLRPFIRWPGGKRWLVSRYPGLISTPVHGTYYEPFLGSAVIFASIQPQRAVLGDLNPELIATFAAVRDDPEAVKVLLEEHHSRHSKKHYYSVRSAVPGSGAEVAARFLYLNRTCFNGIYRVNRKGQFNVPIGSRGNVHRSEDDFTAWSAALQQCELVIGDFESVIQKTSKGDLIYADPPYTVRHNLNAFRKYNESLFSWEDQERLARVLTEATLRGARVIVSNANHETVSDLYPAVFSRHAISRNSSIAAASEKRGAYDELLLWTKGAIDEHVLS